MRSIAISIALLMAAGPALADPGDAQCVAWAKNILDGSAEACSDLCPQAKQFDKYDYRSGLKAAFSSRHGLELFLAYLDRSSIMGAGGDAHACSVQALLVHWGDKTFASALSKQTPKAKDVAIGLLDYSGTARFQARFPQTYSLAGHE